MCYSVEKVSKIIVFSCSIKNWVSDAIGIQHNPLTSDAAATLGLIELSIRKNMNFLINTINSWGLCYIMSVEEVH